MADEEPKRGLSKEAWTAITAITVALISAVVTMMTHYWNPSSPSRPEQAATPSAVPDAPAVASPPTVAALVGRWEGEAKGDRVAFRVHVEVLPGCAPGVRCGEIAVASVPCRGSLYLQGTQGDDFEFSVRDFVAPSTKQCQEGAGEHLQPQPDGTLVYTTAYEPRVRAVLTRQP